MTEIMIAVAAVGLPLCLLTGLVRLGRPLLERRAQAQDRRGPRQSGNQLRAVQPSSIQPRTVQPRQGESTSRFQ